MNTRDITIPIANKAASLHVAGELESAAAIYRGLVDNGGSSTAYSGLGSVLIDLAKADDALVVFAEGLSRHADNLQLAEGRAVSLERLKRFGEAIAAYQAIIIRNPKSALAWNNLGGLLNRQGRNDEATEAFFKALALDPDNSVYYSNVLFSLNYSDHFDQATIYSRHLHWAAKYAEPLITNSFPFKNAPDINRRLRVGYARLSNSFRAARASCAESPRSLAQPPDADICRRQVPFPIMDAGHSPASLLEANGLP